MKFDEIIKWMNAYEMKWGKKPSVVPISELEMMEIINSYPYVRDLGYGKDQVFGVDAQRSPGAEMMRQDMLEIGSKHENDTD